MNNEYCHQCGKENPTYLCKERNEYFCNENCYLEDVKDREAIKRASKNLYEKKV